MTGDLRRGLDEDGRAPRCPAGYFLLLRCSLQGPGVGPSPVHRPQRGRAPGSGNLPHRGRVRWGCPVSSCLLSKGVPALPRAGCRAREDLANLRLGLREESVFFCALQTCGLRPAPQVELFEQALGESREALRRQKDKQPRERASFHTVERVPRSLLSLRFHWDRKKGREEGGCSQLETARRRPRRPRPEPQRFEAKVRRSEGPRRSAEVRGGVVRTWVLRAFCATVLRLGALGPTRRGRAAAGARRGHGSQGGCTLAPWCLPHCDIAACGPSEASKGKTPSAAGQASPDTNHEAPHPALRLSSLSWASL